MSPPSQRRGVGRLACLLTILCTVLVRASASQPPPASVSVTPDQLLEVISKAVTDQIQPLISQLTSRVDRLDSRLAGVDSRLNTLDSRLLELDRLDSRLDELDARGDSRLAELTARVDEVVLRQNSSDSGPGDGVNSRLDSLSSRLEDQSSLLASTGVRLEELTAVSDGRSAQCGEMTRDFPRDCSGLPDGSPSGVHLLQPGLDRSQPLVPAFCDQETAGGGWTVIQRRADITPRQEFYLGWPAYREGFGELDGEFWWGLELLWRLTGPRDRRYRLRVELADFDGGRRHAEYSMIRVSSEADGYRLTIANYSGDAGDSFSHHSGQRFTTKDRDQDSSDSLNCAENFKGAGWYKNCYRNNLNGQYLSGPTTNNNGVNWNAWRGDRYSLKEVELKVRPVKV